jgi:aconitate hydratase
LLKTFDEMGGVVLANACGPCIGQWARHSMTRPARTRSLRPFNRNFAKRNDGNPNTHSFVASPEIVTAFAIAGDLTFNPLTDTLMNENGQAVKLDEPKGIELPVNGFAVEDAGYSAPATDGSKVSVLVDPLSDRLQLLEPFAPWEGTDLTGLRLLIKAKGKCTTDHISMAGPWLKYRGHLDNISNNMLIGATNAFNDKANYVKNQLSGDYDEVPKVQRSYKLLKQGSVVVGDENYGEGSSREHACHGTPSPGRPGHPGEVVRPHPRDEPEKAGHAGADLRQLGGLRQNPGGRHHRHPGADHVCARCAAYRCAQPQGRLQGHDPGEPHLQRGQIEWFKAGSALNLIGQKEKQ